MRMIEPMAIYVDPMMPTKRTRQWPFSASCHLYADTLDELDSFAAQLGLKRAWFQKEEDTGLDHYDLTANKRRLAVKLGAMPQTIREAATLFMARSRERRQRHGTDELHHKGAGG